MLIARRHNRILGGIGNALYLDMGGGKIYSHLSTYVIQSFKWNKMTVFVGFREALLLPAPEIKFLKIADSFYSSHSLSSDPVSVTSWVTFGRLFDLCASVSSFAMWG